MIYEQFVLEEGEVVEVNHEDMEISVAQGNRAHVAHVMSHEPVEERVVLSAIVSPEGNEPTLPDGAEVLVLEPQSHGVAKLWFTVSKEVYN